MPALMLELRRAASPSIKRASCSVTTPAKKAFSRGELKCTQLALESRAQEGGRGAPLPFSFVCAVAPFAPRPSHPFCICHAHHRSLFPLFLQPARWTSSWPKHWRRGR